MMNKLKEIKDKLFKNKKRNIIAICVLIVIILIIILINKYWIPKKDKNTIMYNDIVTMIDNKDTFLIYYYNSKSSNKNNKNIKKYLDKEGIRYFNYNDVLIKREEYSNFLNLINIDKSLFGTPSLIYIKNGKMYGNLINIDNSDIVKQFIDTYDLYVVK